MSSGSVSVVVVSYNTREKLRKCLAAIEPHHEVIVVDNASSDRSADMVAQDFPAAVLIRNQENKGFGAANNLGAEKSTHPLVLFLNSDAYAEPGAIDILSAAFEDPDIVAAGGKLLNPDGTLQDSTANLLTLWAVFCEQLYLEKLLPNSRLFSPYWTTQRLQPLPQPTETPQVMGACLMVRRDLEAFDERYFLYCEDTDLCLRLSRHGQIVYMKEARFTHELGSSSQQDPIKGVIRYNRGKELYFRIHHGRAASTMCFVLDRLGALLRLIVWALPAIASTSARKKASGFAKALFAKRL